MLTTISYTREIQEKITIKLDRLSRESLKKLGQRVLSRIVTKIDQSGPGCCLALSLMTKIMPIHAGFEVVKHVIFRKLQVVRGICPEISGNLKKKGIKLKFSGNAHFYFSNNILKFHQTSEGGRSLFCTMSRDSVLNHQKGGVIIVKTNVYQLKNLLTLKKKYDYNY